MTHPLFGHSSVEDSARLIRNYRYAVERMMRILGGWLALTPEVSAKLLMGRHVWDNAQHADALGRRLPELRAGAHVSEPANSAFVAFMDMTEAPERPHQTVERLVGMYQVLKPHLLATYAQHLASANAVYEPPTQRILSRCAEDERRHIAAGATVLRHLVTTPELEEQARAWSMKLEGLLQEAGGVTGAGMPTALAGDLAQPPLSISDDAREFIRLEAMTTRWVIPPDLESVLRDFGDALVARDPRAIGRLMLSGFVASEEVESRLGDGAFRSHCMVAFSKVGHQRVVKQKLEGAQASVTVTTRWVPAGGSWRAAALDVVAANPATPA